VRVTSVLRRLLVLCASVAVCGCELTEAGGGRPKLVEMDRLYLNGELVKTRSFQARGARPTGRTCRPSGGVLHAHAGVVPGLGSARRPGH
jgi:hypothetical protein